MSQTILLIAHESALDAMREKNPSLMIQDVDVNQFLLKPPILYQKKLQNQLLERNQYICAPLKVEMYLLALKKTTPSADGMIKQSNVLHTLVLQIMTILAVHVRLNMLKVILLDPAQKWAIRYNTDSLKNKKRAHEIREWCPNYL